MLRALRRFSTTAAVATAALAALALVAPAGNAMTEPRIIGGDPVDASTVPWVVALLDASVSNGYQAQFCGGTLIDEEWVLTAAHCVNGSSASSVEVAWGVTNLSDITAGDRHDISQVLVHSAYDGNLMTSDVALLRLAVPATGATTMPVNTDPAVTAAGAYASTYGWGSTAYPGTSYPDELRGVTLVDMAGPSGACGAYGGDFIAFHMVCAGVVGGGKDACYGDSGGPLVASTLSGTRLIGVTSWGYGCALASYPGIWSRVSSYTAWIQYHVSGAQPTVSVGSPTLVEGNTANRGMRFAVVLSAPSTSTVTVQYATADLSATAGTDYTGKSGAISFSPGKTRKYVSVAARPDTDDEADEAFSFDLSSPTNATLDIGSGTGTILDDDPGSGARLSIGDVAVPEGDEGGAVSAQLRVSLSAAAASTVTVTYQTVGGTATVGDDYATKSGTLTFLPGKVSKTVTVKVYPDWIAEGGDHQFTVQLGAPSGPATLVRGTGTVTILDGD